MHARCALLAAVALGACGGGALPGTQPKRESGQSGLMSETFAGKNKCNPKSHDRPFVIEWDATDGSSFEAVIPRFTLDAKADSVS